MRPQIEFARTPQFQAFMRGLNFEGKAERLIHGIFIDFHPMWKYWADYERQTGFRHSYLPYGPMASDPPPAAAYDADHEVPAWGHFVAAEKKELKNPFLVRIYIVPTDASTLVLRQRIERYAQGQPFFATVIEESITILSANVEGGVELATPTSGALGGFLEDQYGKRWGVTCGHVAPTPNAAVALDDMAGTRQLNAGTVRHTNFANLATTTQGGACNPYLLPPPTYPTVDAALFELGPNHMPFNTVRGMGVIDEIYDRTRLNAGSVVRMRGPISGRADYQIGGYGVTTKAQLGVGGPYYCFTDLFEFASPGSGPNWMPGRIVQAAAPRPLQGDSGSWLCFDKQQTQNGQPAYAWFGSLIGVRGATGIAIFAESLRAWAQQPGVGLDLRTF